MIRVKWLLAALFASCVRAAKISSLEAYVESSAASSPLVPFNFEAAKGLEHQLYGASGAARELAVDEVMYLREEHVDLLGHLTKFVFNPSGKTHSNYYLAMAESMRAVCNLAGEGTSEEDACEMLEDLLSMKSDELGSGEVKSAIDWAAEVSNPQVANLLDPSVASLLEKNDLAASVWELAMVGEANFFSADVPFPNPVLWSTFLEGRQGANVVELSGGQNTAWSLRLARMAEKLNLPLDKIVVTEFFGGRAPPPEVKRERGPRVELVEADSTRLGSYIGAGRPLVEGQADVVFARNALCDCDDSSITCGGVAKANPSAACGFFKSVLSLLKPDGVAVFVHTTNIDKGLVATVRHLRSTQGLSAALSPSFPKVLYPTLKGLEPEKQEDVLFTTLVMTLGSGSAELACDQLHQSS